MSPEDLFSVLRAPRVSSVRWGEPVGLRGPGVYVVATEAPRRECPLDPAALRLLLSKRPELRLDGRRATVAELAARLAAFWLPRETVLYVGRTRRSLAARVREYYATPLGARSPHAGGWFLKTLRADPARRVWFAAAGDPVAAEREMLSAFAEGIDATARRRLHDGVRVGPFANLDTAWGCKHHGITNATAPYVKAPAA